MSSAISTESRRAPTAHPADEDRRTPASGFLPWHFFGLVILAAGAAAMVASRGASGQRLLMTFLIVATAGIAGLAIFRTLQPLVRQDAGDQTVMVGRRTRTSLERQKLLILRAIKELEFDYAMKKVSDADFQEMTARLRSRAAGIIRQLESGDGYREQIERELHERLASRGTPGRAATADAASAAPARQAGEADAEPAPLITCSRCSEINDADARFCKACGQKLA